jgi:hypothetical protein
MIELSANATLTDVAFAVCTALDRVGEHAVLCGGSAATYYAPEVYQSRDLDEALRPLGYLRAPERFYQHPVIPYTVEFPAGPLAIGSETVTEHATLRRGPLLLHVYTVTDVVRDRFMHFWAWSDQAALRVALDVAGEHPAAVDIASIEAWTEGELREAPVYDRARRDYFLTELRRTIDRRSR